MNGIIDQLQQDLNHGRRVIQDLLDENDELESEKEDLQGRLDEKAAELQVLRDKLAIYEAGPNAVASDTFIVDVDAVTDGGDHFEFEASTDVVTRVREEDMALAILGPGGDYTSPIPADRMYWSWPQFRALLITASTIGLSEIGLLVTAVIVIWVL